MNNKRPSVYLESKCKTFSEVLDFFVAGTFHKKIDEKLMAFVFQIDFWDWEMENIIFSFTNFQERSDAWASSRGMGESILNKFGILVKDSWRQEGDRVFNRHVREHRGEAKVVAPWNKLKEIVDKWNKLLTTCEERILQPENKLENAIKLGAQILPDLSKYKKEMPHYEP